MQRLAVQEEKVQSSLGFCAGLLPAASPSVDPQVPRVKWCSTLGSAPVDTEGGLYPQKRRMAVTNARWSRQAQRVRLKKMMPDSVRSFVILENFHKESSFRSLNSFFK